MKQIHRLLLFTITFMMLMCGTAFANEISPANIIAPAFVECGWKQDVNGWWYQRVDGSYPINQWELIDDTWYCFNKDGYMLANTYIFNIGAFERKIETGFDIPNVYFYYVTSDGSMLVNNSTPYGDWANALGEINPVYLKLGLNNVYWIE